MDAFFNPRSVAVIGATKKVDKAGHVIFKNFATNKERGVFKGELYPVNPGEDSILGFKCYKSLCKVPCEVELIVVIVPANSCALHYGRSSSQKGQNRHHHQLGL